MTLIRKPEESNGSTEYAPWLTPEVFGKSGKGTVNLLGTMHNSEIRNSAKALFST